MGVSGQSGSGTSSTGIQYAGDPGTGTGPTTDLMTYVSNLMGGSAASRNALRYGTKTTATPSGTPGTVFPGTVYKKPPPLGSKTTPGGAPVGGPGTTPPAPEPVTGHKQQPLPAQAPATSSMAGPGIAGVDYSAGGPGTVQGSPTDTRSMSLGPGSTASSTFTQLPDGSGDTSGGPAGGGPGSGGGALGPGTGTGTVTPLPGGGSTMPLGPGGGTPYVPPGTNPTGGGPPISGGPTPILDNNPVTVTPGGGTAVPGSGGGSSPGDTPPPGGSPTDYSGAPGGIQGMYQGWMGSTGFDDPTLNAIRNQSAQAARGASDSALSDINQRYAGTGNEAGFYAGRGGVARTQQQAMADSAQKTAIANYSEGQRLRELGTAGEQNLYNSDTTDMNTYLASLQALTGRKVGVNTNSDTSGQGFSVDLGSIIGALGSG